MSSRFVNPFTDLGFKIIFGQPASKALLIILLNELLSGEHHIEDLTFLDKEDRSEIFTTRVSSMTFTAVPLRASTS